MKPTKELLEIMLVLILAGSWRILICICFAFIFDSKTATTTTTTKWQLDKRETEPGFFFTTYLPDQNPLHCQPPTKKKRPRASHDYMKLFSTPHFRSGNLGFAVASYNASLGAVPRRVATQDQEKFRRRAGLI